jgi:hypothetical protein
VGRRPQVAVRGERLRQGVMELTTQVAAVAVVLLVAEHRAALAVQAWSSSKSPTQLLALFLVGLILVTMRLITTTDFR